MMKNYTTVSALFLSVAALGMNLETANAQAVVSQTGQSSSAPSTPSTPAGPVSQPAQKSQNMAQAAPRFFTRDLDFELKMFDYNVRGVVQALVDNPDNPRMTGAIIDLANRYDDPRKVEYLYGMVDQLLVYNDERVRKYGALLTYFTINSNGHHKGLEPKVKDIAKILSDRIENDSNSTVRGNAVMALVSAGEHYPSLAKTAFDTLVKVSGDKDSYVRQQVASRIVDLGGNIDPAKVSEVLETYLKDMDSNTVRNAENGLRQLEELQKSARQAPPMPSTTLIPVPSN